MTQTASFPTFQAADGALADAPATHRLPGAARGVVLALLIGLVASILSLPQAASATIASHSRTSYEAALGSNLLKRLNSERHDHHLGALTMNSQLMASARQHDIAMARANSMSHQLRGEAYFAKRISAAGYKWRAAGENIAWNSRISNAGVQQLEMMMYHEKAPNDGHRRNILSSSYRNIGVDIYIDNVHHKVWLTTDFGRK